MPDDNVSQLWAGDPTVQHLLQLLSPQRRQWLLKVLDLERKRMNGRDTPATLSGLPDEASRVATKAE